MGLRFLAEFVRHPLSVGAIAPSSRALAREITSDIGLEKAHVVAEYGPGTGAFTGEILAHLRPGAAFLAIEANARMAETFRRRFPQATLIEGSVADVREHTRSLGHGHVDVIVCGLPWASFSDSLQDALLSPTLEVLRPGGRFATFAYNQGLLLPAGRRFRRKLMDRFAEVTTSRTVWRNVPPAFVYRCTR